MRHEQFSAQLAGLIGGCSCNSCGMGALDKKNPAKVQRAADRMATRVRTELLPRAQLAANVYVHGALGALGVAPGQPAFLPVSDRSAVTAAVKLFAQANAAKKGLSGAQETGAMQGAAAGAKAGSIVPIVGTVIGAVIGALAGYILAKNHDVRPSKGQIADCQGKVAEYMKNAAQSPAQPMPLTLDALKDLNWCMMALWGSDIGNKDPRYFDGNFTDTVAMARKVVHAIYETPVGQKVDFTFATAAVEQFASKQLSGAFVNPPFTNLADFTDNVWDGIVVQYCIDQTREAGCGKLFTRHEYRRLVYDIIGAVAQAELPNISEADLQAASTVAQAVGPTTAAKDVVAAVEAVMNKTVIKGEVAKALAPVFAAPVPSVPVGAPTPTQVATAQNDAANAIKNQAVPISPTGVSTQDATAAILAQLMKNIGAPPVQQTNALATQAAQTGIQPPMNYYPPQATPTSAPPQAAGTGFDLSKMWPLAVLGVLGVVVAKSSKKRGRRP
jgi:hypothetical protein